MDHSNAAGMSLDLHDDTNCHAIEGALPGYIATRRWFGAKTRTISQARIVESLSVGSGDSHRAHIAIVELTYAEGDTQYYVVPLRLTVLTATGDDGGAIGGEIARWQVQAVPAPLTVVASDATFDDEFAAGLLEAIAQNTRWAGESGYIVAWPGPELQSLMPADISLAPSVLGSEQSNTSIRYGHSLILKLFRRLEEGTSPELEIARALQAVHFAETPPLGGAIEYARGDREPLTLAVLQGYVPNRGDAWGYTIETLVDYFDQALEGSAGDAPATLPNADPLELAGHDVPAGFATIAAGYPDSAALLGRTTARMHLALAGANAGPAFDPEPLEIEHLEHMYAVMRLQADQAFGLLRAKSGELPPDATDEAASVLQRTGALEAHFGSLVRSKADGLRTRVHGDYHLGQVLYTGSAFYIIDFEGEPARSLAERRRKHSPLKDVAGMLRSFHYAAYSGLFNHGRKRGRSLVGDRDAELWADAWYSWSSAAFLRAYLATIEGAGLMPGDPGGLRVLLSSYLLEKAVYELVYELNNRPTWVTIPLKGISALLS